MNPSLSQSLYHPIFTFSSPQFKANKLLDKMVPSVEVDTVTNTVKCKDGDAQVTIIRAQHSLPTTGIVAYFQVEILKCSISHPDECGINLGLITKDGNPRAYAGKYMNSIGQINGQVYMNKKKVSTFPPVHFGKKDRIGCGINCSNSSFFFTKNSQIFIKDIMLPEGSKWNEFYPAVALQYQQETVKCYFQKKDFLFDIDKLATQIQSQVQQQILITEDQEIPSSEIYSLISEYMLFNGYSKTLQRKIFIQNMFEVMKQKKDEIQFQPVNKLTKSIPGTKLLINLDEEYRLQQQQQQQKDKKMREQQQQIQQKQRQKQQLQQFAQQMQEITPIEIKQTRNRSASRSARQRIMSEVQPQIQPEQSLMVEEQDEPRRKNTEMGEYVFIGEDNNNFSNNTFNRNNAFTNNNTNNNKYRKQSNLSNISLIDEEQINYNIAEQKIINNNQQHSKLSQNMFQQALSLNQRFLLNQRLEILSLIKDKKIQCAQKIILSKIPKLYEIQPLLEAHMKAHIFLRKIIEEDQNSAIIYGRTQPKFANNIDKLFPSYDQETGLIQMIPMKKILTSIVVNKNKQHKFLRKEQFEYFAEYVNSLIMKCMGVMGNSRLGVILEHTSIALRKLQQFKGMTCGIKLMN